LFSRWISSTKSRMGRPVRRRSSSASPTIWRSSFTPWSTDEKATVRTPLASPRRRASVVFPVPGGPHRMSDSRRPAASRSLSPRPGPSRWRCPTNSSTVRGRMRSASGARPGFAAAPGARENSSDCRGIRVRLAHASPAGTASWRVVRERAARVAMGRVRTVGLVVKRNMPRASRLARRMVASLRRRGVTVLVDAEAPLAGLPARPKAGLVRESDLIVVLGGDGTLLSVARQAAARVPILGVNMGELGFLTEVAESEAMEMLGRVLAGKYEIDRRMTLTAALERQGRVVHRYPALNDVVISNGALARIIRCTVSVDGVPFTTYRAD